MTITDDLNAISDRVFELEQENNRLKSPAPNPAADEFIRLMAGHMQMLNGHKETLAEPMAELLRAYAMAGGKQYLEGEKENE